VDNENKCRCQGQGHDFSGVLPGPASEELLKRLCRLANNQRGCR
jgi:hypothetical protein